MTDIPTAAKALIEAIGKPYVKVGQWADEVLDRWDEYRALDDGSTLARWAAIGEAVERLRATLPENWGASLNMTQGDGDGAPYSVSIWDEGVRDIDPMPSWCEDVPAAISAALGEP